MIETRPAEVRFQTFEQDFPGDENLSATTRLRSRRGGRDGDIRKPYLGYGNWMRRPVETRFDDSERLDIARHLSPIAPGRGFERVQPVTG